MQGTLPPVMGTEIKGVATCLAKRGPDGYAEIH